ncbi:hypothetical protein BJ508DRAFT_302732 [Ascobolus immersus RN42]|uniref:Afadin and alpha-actinin-binding-domain-containing protein n=1 Tax=Ascobolus immersus RN42 TaxID=1160509 RepID=A0A3N4IL75_ASCIM|nr:hypothetical protein BJ508DRAFT_302732 [Ascobolus immersus RN42]
MELEAASRYVNGLLAKAGLVRGDPIRFDNPGKEPGTERRILNLVHELIARRERETEQMETLVMTVQALKNDNTKKETKIARLGDRIGDLEQQLASMKAQNRVAIGSQNSAEFALKTQREETARLKTLLMQVKSKCANDIRQRDVQIARMKDQLADNARRATGTRRQPAFMSTSYAAINAIEEPPVTDEAVILAQETTEELTERCRTLIDENDTLLSLLKRTLKMLNSIQGLDTEMGLDDEMEYEDNIGVNVANSEILANQLHEALTSLQQIVNQPNYVPVEEVHARDAEIARIKQESEKIEQEWKKAIALVDQWNKSVGKPPRNTDESMGRMEFSGISVSAESEHEDESDGPVSRKVPGGNGSNPDLSTVMEEDEGSEDERMAEDDHHEPARTPPQSMSPRQPVSEKKPPVSIEKLKRSIRTRGSLTPQEMEQLLKGEVDE